MAGQFGRLAWDIALGPLTYLRRSPLKSVTLFLVVILLTVLTQVGGAILWLTMPLLDRLYVWARSYGWVVAMFATTVGFLALYIGVALTVVPVIATTLGRQPLPCFPSERHRYGASSVLYCLTNRHYAVPLVHSLMDALATDLHREHPGSVVSYLDAGFPFIDGFPLLPHLSHHDGRKIDLAFFYRDARSGVQKPRAGAWPIGYWAYSPAKGKEPRPCAADDSRFSLRWDFTLLQPRFAAFALDEERTQALLSWLVLQGAEFRIEKVLLEPHLKGRLGLDSPLIRFQGCRAARHDDHLHVQVK